MTQALKFLPAEAGSGLVTFASLADADAAIDRYVFAWAEAAQAVLDVEQDELWRERYESFDEWVESRRDESVSRIRQLTRAARFIRDLSVHDPDLPIPPSEKVTRVILRIKRRRDPKDWRVFTEDEDQHAERRRLAWRTVVDQAKSDKVEVITAPYVAEHVDAELHHGGRKTGTKSKQWKLSDLEDCCARILEIKRQWPKKKVLKECADPGADLAYVGDAVAYLEDLVGA